MRTSWPAPLLHYRAMPLSGDEMPLLRGNRVARATHRARSSRLSSPAWPRQVPGLAAAAQREQPERTGADQQEAGRLGDIRQARRGDDPGGSHLDFG